MLGKKRAKRCVRSFGVVRGMAMFCLWSPSRRTRGRWRSLVCGLRGVLFVGLCGGLGGDVESGLCSGLGGALESGLCGGLESGLCEGWLCR